MKKLLVLSVLLGLMALPMFASDISFGGDATFGVVTDFGGVEAEKTDLTFDVKAKIDDFNSLTINMDALEKNLKTGGSAGLDGVGVSKALVTTDIGKWLGLEGVGVKLNWGYDDPDWASFAAVSSYDNWSVYLSPDEYWGLDLLVSYKMLDFEFAMNPGSTDAGALGYLLAGLAVKEPIKGLNAEVYYFQNKGALDAFDVGLIGFDAAYATEVAGFSITAAPQFILYLDDAAANSYLWYLALAGSYDMFSLDAEVMGDETDAFAGLDAVVKVSPVEKADIYAGVVLSFREGDDAFQGADLGVNLKMGAVNGYVGYLITEVGQADINGYFSPTDGGMYVAFDVNY